MADGWKKSKLSEAKISSLVSRHLLQPRSIVQWRSGRDIIGLMRRLRRPFCSSPLLSMALLFRFVIFYGVCSSIGGSNFII